jgi:hypothetical protein
MRREQKLMLGMAITENGMYYEGNLGRLVTTKAGHINLAINDCRKLTYIGEGNIIKAKTHYEPGLFLIPRKRFLIHDILSNCSEGDLIRIKTDKDPFSGKILVCNVERQ